MAYIAPYVRPATNRPHDINGVEIKVGDNVHINVKEGYFAGKHPDKVVKSVSRQIELRDVFIGGQMCPHQEFAYWRVVTEDNSWYKAEDCEVFNKVA